MDRIPKAGSKYTSSSDQSSDGSPPLKPNKRVAGHKLSPLKTAAKILSKIKEKTSLLKRLRQKKVIKSSAANDWDNNENAGEPFEQIASDYHEQTATLPADSFPAKNKSRRSNIAAEQLSPDDSSDTDTDVDNLLTKVSRTSHISSMLGKGLQGLRRKPPRTPSSGNPIKTSDFLEAQAAKIATTANATTGALSAVRQAYHSEQNVKKTHSKALDLIESLTLEDILSTRITRAQKNRPISRGEVEAYIVSALAKKAKKATISAGLVGTFTLGSFIGTGAFFLFPFIPATLASIGIGCAVTALFSKINQNRVRKKVQKFFFHIQRSSTLSEVDKALEDKIKTFNKALKTTRPSPIIETRSHINYREVIDNSLLSLGHASGFINMGARFVKVLGYLSVGIRTLTSFISALFTGVTNYRDRQKKLTQMDTAITESIFPNIMARTFPYIKAPLFQRFVIHNKEAIGKALNLHRGVANSVLLQRLNSSAYRSLKKQLQSECIKRLIREKFCRFAGIDKELLDHLSDAEFEDRYSHVFQKFMMHKLGGSIFGDTMGAGISGTFTLATGIFSLSFFPTLVPIVFPVAVTTLGIGSLVTLITARHEEGKFKAALNKVITTGKPVAAAQTYLKFKKLMMEKNDNLSH